MPILEGSYIYLLIFQIIVISLLLLFLLWLVIRRLRGLNNVETLTVPVTNNTQDEALIKLTNQQREKIASLEQELLRLENAASNIKALQDENGLLKEKIKTLEKKLLEYEILQEEIGTLSYLKIENEKLRKQIMEQQTSAPLSRDKKDSILEANNGETTTAEKVIGETTNIPETVKTNTAETTNISETGETTTDETMKALNE